MMKIAIIDYNLGNLFSVMNAVLSLGIDAIITKDRQEILSSDAAILPGVGAFNVAMTNIRNNGLDRVIKDFINTGKPFIGICLGFQLLFSRSFEFGETSGLDIIEGDVLRLPDIYLDKKIRVPNVGWLSIYNNNNEWIAYELNGIKQNEFMYFVHSYYAKPKDSNYVVAYSTYENFEFCCAIKKGNVFGVQFHPEKSGKYGHMIYSNIQHIIESEKSKNDKV